MVFIPEKNSNVVGKWILAIFDNKYVKKDNLIIKMDLLNKNDI